jgi:hypothetical protein
MVPSDGGMLIARRFCSPTSRLRFDRHHEEISATEPEDVAVTVTPADHAWENAYPGASPRRFKDEDSAGFWIETPYGDFVTLPRYTGRTTGACMTSRAVAKRWRG